MWDITFGGSTIAGKTSKQAAERETLEEVGYSKMIKRSQLDILSG